MQEFLVRCTDPNNGESWIHGYYHSLHNAEWAANRLDRKYPCILHRIIRRGSLEWTELHSQSPPPPSTPGHPTLFPT